MTMAIAILDQIYTTLTDTTRAPLGATSRTSGKRPGLGLKRSAYPVLSSPSKNAWSNTG